MIILILPVELEMRRREDEYRFTSKYSLRLTLLKRLAVIIYAQHAGVWSFLKVYGRRGKEDS